MSRVATNGGSELMGDGEHRDRARRNRKRVIIGGLFLIGLFGGLLAGLTQSEDMLSGRATWPRDPCRVVNPARLIVT